MVAAPRKFPHVAITRPHLCRLHDHARHAPARSPRHQPRPAAGRDQPNNPLIASKSRVIGGLIESIVPLSSSAPGLLNGSELGRQRTRGNTDDAKLAATLGATGRRPLHDSPCRADRGEQRTRRAPGA